MRDADARVGERWPIVVDTVALLVMYAAGLAVAWLVWAPLSVLYLAVILACNLLFVARICPYCRHSEAGNCPTGYHLVARYFPRREGRTFAREYQRNVPVMYPVWAFPPVVGLYGVLRDLSKGLDWGLLAVLVVFCLLGFVVLPIASRKICDRCANAAECPRAGRRGGVQPSDSFD